jgi:hypothetical protein
MAGATEIYICKPGQEIKEGRVEYADLETRAEAASDAERRCSADPTIGKIAYYRLSEDGGFKTLYSYDNPDAEQPKPARRAAAQPARSGRRQPVQRRRSLFERVRTFLEED